MIPSSFSLRLGIASASSSVGVTVLLSAERHPGLFHCGLHQIECFRIGYVGDHRTLSPS
jgi:hypothetical protein